MNSAAAASQSTSRDIIMKEIADQAADVRRAFEEFRRTSKAKQVSSATEAAARHMASVNRKRKFENGLVEQRVNNARGGEVWKSTSRTFHSAIASFTRPEKKRVVSSDVSNPTVSQSTSQDQSRTAVAPHVCDGIVLKSSHGDINVTYNDVVCGKGRTTSSLVGNQRYNVWIDLKKEAFAKALFEEDRRRIALSAVDAVATSVPQGRFLSLDARTGLWYDVGYARAVGITLEKLMAETGMMRPQFMMARPCGAGQPIARKTIISRAA